MKVSDEGTRKKMTMKEFAAMHDIPYTRFHWRIRNGCSALQAAFMTKKDFDKKRETHGMNGTPTYRVWESMIQRCKSSPIYVRRGIFVCERWRKFENFFADMGRKPEGLSLDRIDNDLGYSKENCRWTDMKTQCRNTSRNVQINYMGKSQCASAWCEELGIPVSTVTWRLKKGFTDYEALFGRKYVRTRP